MHSNAMERSPLFAGMTAAEIAECLRCSGAEEWTLARGEVVFAPGDLPQYVFVLQEGRIAVGQDDAEGNRHVVAVFDRAGELFGEVFLFVPDCRYEHYAQAETDARVLRIPKAFLYSACGNACGHHQKMIANMLSVLAGKAYFLNRRVQILAGASLRQKIARACVFYGRQDGTVALPMDREGLAAFLGAARPSVSRELMRMQQDGLIAVEKKTIRVADMVKLRSLL